MSPTIGSASPPAASISSAALKIVPGSFGCGSAVFAIRATFAPSRAARSAIARPIPRLPPDMNIVRPPRSLTARSLCHPQRRMVKLGYKASAEQFGPRELVEFAVLAEELGYDTVVVSDHFQPWRHDGGHAPFSFAWLAAVGERTERILLGTSVVAPAYRYHPGIVAQAMATLGCLYPGRVFLGVGTGESMNEVPLGVHWPEQKVRFQMLKEACQLMQRLWTEERVTFEGEHFQTENATIYDRPEGGIPLYIAASGPAAARLAGRMASGFITTSGKATELYAERLIPAVREGAEKEGRSMDQIELTIEMKVSYDTDLERAMEDTRHW